jgi:hypothetical protein
MSARAMATAVGLVLVLSITPLAAQEKQTAAPLVNHTPTVAWNIGVRRPARTDIHHAGRYLTCEGPAA